VAGFREALQMVSLVQITPGLTVRVASLPGLALLKRFAWYDIPINI
jgi:predicted nucleotidyltransferase